MIFTHTCFVEDLSKATFKTYIFNVPKTGNFEHEDLQLVPEVYWEPVEDVQWSLFVKIVKYFCKKASSQIFEWVLNTPLITSTLILFLHENGAIMSVFRPLHFIYSQNSYCKWFIHVLNWQFSLKFSYFMKKGTVH